MRPDVPRPPTAQQQCRHCGVLAGEGQLLLDELHSHSAARQGAHQGAQVIEVAGETVHRVHDHRVALADEGEHRLQLRPGSAPAQGAVSERPIQRHAVELPGDVLVQAADPGVADLLSRF
jgi:hypothetical protein